MHYVKEKHKISSLNKWHRPKNLPITLYYIYSAVSLDYLFCKYISVEAKYYANMSHTYLNSWPSYLHETASHLCHLSLLWMVKVKNTQKKHCQAGHHKKKTFWVSLVFSSCNKKKNPLGCYICNKVCSIVKWKF